MGIQRIITCDVCGIAVEPGIDNRLERFVSISPVGHVPFTARVLIQISSDYTLCAEHKRSVLEELFKPYDGFDDDLSSRLTGRAARARPLVRR